MKKMTVLFILLIDAISSFQVAAAEMAASEMEVIVNGNFVRMEVPPAVIDNYTYLPIRALSSLGLSYRWEPGSKTAVVQNKAGDELKITVDQKTATKNGKSLGMETPARSQAGRVLVPARFVTEALGYRVQYESIRSFVFITSPDYQTDRRLLEQNDLQIARATAISLPITTPFKPLAAKTYKDHAYFFPGGRADVYAFYDGYTTSVIEIKDGKAILAGQWIQSPQGNEYLGTAGTVFLLSDPALEPLIQTGVKFSRTGNGITTDYWQEGRKEGTFTSPYKVYSDFIQRVPENL
ncbi:MULTISPECIES: copper amine oxidase N-terminal domain-containing protein [Paenibacillus]|uniref:copper amine oxidase N-terminal domain-containing protein n=1 Tax=Paenibacillus TaxID=44249 RepID=UPI002FDF5CEC